ncbi:hypothetical protein [Paracoccus sp. SJTW-4]|uniref:hypothetical protein n=1 Tax=Paracoccus sp. SJTW-4 TaxID=3078428 RepID=UPI0039E74154
MTDAEIASGGYQHLLTPELRLAHEALLRWAEECEPDGWPTPASVLRFAACYGVPSAPLGALFGLLSYRHGRQTAWVDDFRQPGFARMVGAEKFGRSVMASYGIFRAADAVLRREVLH